MSAAADEGRSRRDATPAPGTPGAVETALWLEDLPVGPTPSGMAIAPDGSRIYVGINGAVAVIDTSDNHVADTITVSGAPNGLAVTPNGSKVYVANGTGSVNVISTASPHSVTTFTLVPYPTPSAPYWVAINSSGSRVYVTDQAQKAVFVLSGSNTVIGTVQLADFPYVVAVNPSGSRVYVGDSSGAIRVIDALDNTVIGSIELPGSLPAGMVFNADGTRLYAANQADNRVFAIDPASGTVVATITLPEGAISFAVALSPEGGHLYVTDPAQNALCTVDTATNEVVRVDTVGSYPFCVVAGLDGTHLYVSDTSQDTVSILLAPPALTGISPLSGPTAGGNTVTVTGTGLSGATAVRVGGGRGSGIVVGPDGRRLTFTAPPGTGTVPVVVTTPAGDSNALRYTYTPAATTTTLVSSANPSAPGAEVTFTATVSPVPPASGSPDGTVTFTVDGVAQPPVALVGGQATLTVPAPAEGSHTVTAHYNGSAGYAPSTSSTLTQTVVPLATTLTAARAMATIGLDRQAHISSLSATLTDQYGHPVAGQRVVFTIGGTRVAAAVTDASGVATSTDVVVDPQFLIRSGSRYTATLTAGPAYQGASATAAVVLS